MPMYAVECEECGKKLEEFVCSVAERDEKRCECGGKLTNDYARHKTSNFQLKGGGWPGKEIALGNQVMRERNQD